jgi:hypothetical protein
MGSAPTVAAIRPKRPEINPFKSDSPERLAMIVKPKATKEKNSHGPNFKAILANGGAKKRSKKALIIPPKKDAQTPKHKALPASPFLAMGYPSKTVATEEGVPGMPMRIPEIWPPANPPTNTPIIAANPSIDFIPKVSGKRRAAPMVTVKPGIQPTTIPAIVPKKRKLKDRVEKFLLNLRELSPAFSPSIKF